jgi:hypothetical protein
VGYFGDLLLSAVEEGDEEAGRLWASFCRPASSWRAPSLLSLCRSARAAGACWWLRPHSGAVAWARSRRSSALSSRPVFAGSARLVGGAAADLLFCFGPDIAAAAAWAAAQGGRVVAFAGLTWVIVAR